MIICPLPIFRNGRMNMCGGTYRFARDRSEGMVKDKNRLFFDVLLVNSRGLTLFSSAPDSINNPFGAGSPYRFDSPTNPFGEGLEIYGGD